MSAQDKLRDIISDFAVDKFSEFFRLKMQQAGNFRPSGEAIDIYNDSDFQAFKKIGQIEFSSTEKLVIVGAKSLKSLSERSGKKTQYEKAKKILKELDTYSAGIFIYYDEIKNYRFSLIYPEYSGTKRSWNSFKRYTYFVSQDQTNKTFLLQVGDVDFSTIEKVKEAFSVEKVTKEFYFEYRNLFENLLGALNKNHGFINEASKYRLNISDFAKKLLGQIVFLYFIQKKGWLGVPVDKPWGSGDKNFLRTLYEKALKEEHNFFKDYLEELFYATLNNPHRGQADPSYSLEFKCRIPFLNGGLFEPDYEWKRSVIYLDNELFGNILDVFDRYNFTVEESNPDDKEVAVDPEMLGKVFENLLPENLRKGKGTYYTPREIVYYMCRESLANYLTPVLPYEQTKELMNCAEDPEKCGELEINPKKLEQIENALKLVRICDPACGSGAFLVSMLNEIVKLRQIVQLLMKQSQDSEYKLKKETIQNCIYGVDIDPGAVDIAKLRLWLALVVDYELKDIEPLPNLDYRIMCGNSLIEEFEGIKFYDDRVFAGGVGALFNDNVRQNKIQGLKNKIKEYFSIHDDELKMEKRGEINNIKDYLIKSAIENRRQELAVERKAHEELANRLTEKNRKEYLKTWSNKFISEAKLNEVAFDLHYPKKSKPFFLWKLEFIDVFEEKGGFDIMVANPPYLSSKNIDDALKPVYENIFYSPTAHYDIYIIFIEKALQLLKDGGGLCFITSNKYFSQKYGSRIREIILKKYLLRIINFNFKIFEATVDTAITIIKNTNNQVGHNVRVLNLYDIDLKNSDVSSLGEILTDEAKYQIIEQDFFKELPDSNFRLDVQRNDFNLKGKIYKETIPLAEICFVIYGAVLHNADKNIKKEDFIYQEKNKDLKPYVEGKFISRWRVNKIFWLKYTPEIHREPRYLELFENAKLVGKRIIGREGLSFLYDRNDLYVDNTVYVIIPYYSLPQNKYSQLNSVLNDSRIKLSKEYSLLFLLSIINSSLFKWLFQKFFSFGLDIYPAHIKRLPIKTANQKEQKPFIDLVDKVLAVTKDDDYLETPTKQAKVRGYEKQIDQLVYKLYGLTPEEIKIVEGK